MAKDLRPTIAFFEFRLNRSAGEHLGGTGVYLQSLVSFLEGQAGRARIRFVPDESARVSDPAGAPAAAGRAGIAWLRKQLRDVVALLSAGEELLLFHYPKIPFLGRSRQWKALVLAVLAYGSLVLKLRLTGRKLAILIQDLPLEQIHLAPGTAPLDLSIFYGAGPFTAAERRFAALEGFLFRAADVLISPSNLLTKHIVRKHGVDPGRVLLKPRDAYVPTADPAVARLEVETGRGPAVLYGGDLGLPAVRRTLPALVEVVKAHPEATLLLCGRRGEWLGDPGPVSGVSNVRYLGALDAAALEGLAARCQIGLLLYDRGYYDLMTTAKYSLYAAHGMAVLATELTTLKEIIQEDGVGMAVRPETLPGVLEEWLADPERIEPYRERARALAPRFRDGSYLETWFGPLLERIRG